MSKTPNKKVKADPELQRLERQHGHCADLLMSDYSISKEHRQKILKGIDGCYHQSAMFHDIIITSVRGWSPHPATSALKSVLDGLATKPPKNHKPERAMGRCGGTFDSRGHYHESEPDYDF